ncbi:uncharacterized protein MELLADRAFT_93976 [Melampsora larici-populina 98AG31]|uniref:RRM domain-containing protein n=1 Tax=Melampsora larici-populina (strain 98AG31 / pathotype 3-4-7) TaxID=747676 RepID=F4S5Z1_MELLP|nr:uncharacterized protein MELLADRAFT_93976 [Melampsora larici-populina 98AG31]EGF99935.1 hypothetical protein MELLADRAFT_93976 [Melampsora larici-populina 98AG31]
MIHRHTKLHGKHNLQPGRLLFVGSVAWYTDTNSLTQALNQFGKVVDSIVMQDRKTGRSRGFGFITVGLILSPQLTTTHLLSTPIKNPPTSTS